MVQGWSGKEMHSVEFHVQEDCSLRWYKVKLLEVHNQTQVPTLVKEYLVALLEASLESASFSQSSKHQKRRIPAWWTREEKSLNTLEKM